MIVEYNSEGFKHDIEEKLIESINGSSHRKKRVTLNEQITGSISFPMVPGAALRFLKNGIGDAITVTSLAAGVFQYKFIAGINSLTLMTFEACRDTTDTASVYRYDSCAMNSIKFSCGVNDVLMCDIDVVGRAESFPGSITTAAYRTQNPYTFVNGSIKIGDSSATATSPVVDNWSVSVANNMVESRGIGSSKVTSFVPGMQDVTYEISAQFDDLVHYNRFLNGTLSYVYAKFDNGITISATYTHSITFESFKCYFNGTTPNVGGANDILKTSYPVRSIWADGSSTTLLITVVTDVATLTTS